VRRVLRLLGLTTLEGWLLLFLLGIPPLAVQLTSAPRHDAQGVELPLPSSDPGSVLLRLPFDPLGRIWGGIVDDEEGGHIRAVRIASLVYGLLGLLLVRRVLEDLVPRGVAFLAVVLLLYGTFLYWYLTEEAALSPALSFFSSALVLSVFWDGRGGLTPARALALGLLISLAASVRGPNGLLLLLPFGVLLASWKKDPWGTFRKGLLVLFPLALVAMKVLSPLKDLGNFHLLETFFSSRHGLLFWTPLLWGGFLGYLGFWKRERRTGLLLLLPLLLMSLVNAWSPRGGEAFSNPRFDSSLPFLAVGLAFCLEAVRNGLARRPAGVLVALGGALVLWNFLFMEQYRRAWIPHDDTVSFAKVTENSASLVSSAVGSPLAWPANWIFALRNRVGIEQYDLLVGKSLFSGENNLGGVVKLGEGPADPALLDQGWSSPRRVSGAICRGVLGKARIFVPLDTPEALDVCVRSSGSGTLSIAVNGEPFTVWPLPSDWNDVSVSVPAERWKRGLNEISFASEGEAFIESVVFQEAER
jgi:hypothetical protein